MNSARPLTGSSRPTPPPLPQPRNLAVVPPPPDEREITAVGDVPPEVLRVARSDVRELRVPRPAPRPTPVPPPLPIPVPIPAQLAREATMEVTPEEIEISAAIKPPPFLVVRTTWFFGVFVASAAVRWTFQRLSRGRAWLAAEWRRAASRASSVTRR
jgi:hypothetical protein